MSISALNSQPTQPLLSSLSAGLETNGLSEAKTKTVVAEIKAVITTADKSKTDIPDPAAIKESINAQIASDVEKGLITQDEANIITASLDEFTATNPPPPPAGGGAGGGGGNPEGAGGSGGGGSGAEGGSETTSTEVSSVESSTSNSGWTTKTTTYTDDTQNTEYTYNAADDKTISQSGQDNTLSNVLEKNGGNTNATAYLASILTTPRLNIIA